MGAFASKLSEAAEKVQSENDVEENKRDGDSKRIDVVTVKTNPNAGGFKPPSLSMVIVGYTLFMMGVAVRHSSHAAVKMSLERCEDMIKEIEAIFEREGAQDPYLVMKLNKWKKKRDKAEAYMKEHKFIGKLVQMFPPDL